MYKKKKRIFERIIHESLRRRHLIIQPFLTRRNFEIHILTATEENIIMYY